MADIGPEPVEMVQNASNNSECDFPAQQGKSRKDEDSVTGAAKAENIASDEGKRETAIESTCGKAGSGDIQRSGGRDAVPKRGPRSAEAKPQQHFGEKDLAMNKICDSAFDELDAKTSEGGYQNDRESAAPSHGDLSTSPLNVEQTSILKGKA